MKAKSPGKAAPSAAGGSPNASAARAHKAQQQQQPPPPQKAQQQQKQRASKSDVMAMGGFVLVALIAFIGVFEPHMGRSTGGTS